MSAPPPSLHEEFDRRGDSLPEWLPVHAAIADTSALFSDIIGTARYGAPSVLLLTMAAGFLRVYVPQQVWAEMPRKLSEIAEKDHLDLGLLERLWWIEYMPLIRVVDTAPLPASQEGFAIEEEDPTDRPTVVLADLLAPIPILATDKDLRRHGLACDDWKVVAKACRRIGLANGTVYGGAVLAAGGFVAAV